MLHLTSRPILEDQNMKDQQIKQGPLSIELVCFYLFGCLFVYEICTKDLQVLHRGKLAETSLQ